MVNFVICKYFCTFAGRLVYYVTLYLHIERILRTLIFEGRKAKP